HDIYLYLFPGLLDHQLTLHPLLLVILPFLIHRLPPSPLFPYTTLFRSRSTTSRPTLRTDSITPHRARSPKAAPPAPRSHPRADGDRKSTRLNSSHVSISYAVFCLKKKIFPAPHSVELQSEAAWSEDTTE